MTDTHIQVTTGGQRIDQYLTKEFSYSRNFWERVIERGGVKIVTRNQKPVTGNQKSVAGMQHELSHHEGSEAECGDPYGDCFVPHNDQGTSQKKMEIRLVKKSYILKDGDTIFIDSVERYIDGGILAESPVIPLDIRREKEEYLVLYKAKGILSHPNSIRDVAQPNIVGGLYHHYKDLPSMANFIRAGLLHRLDKDTDGFMIIAKTEQGLAYFKELFQQKSGASTIAEKEAVPLKKFYRAVCDLSDEGIRFLDAIKEYPYYLEGFIHPKVPYPGEPKWGITKILEIRDQKIEDRDKSLEIRDRKQGIGNTLELQLEILTGRTHQIRYQLTEVGLPIVGDYLYNARCKMQDVKDLNEPMQLTAWKLEFLDPSGEMISISLDP